MPACKPKIKTRTGLPVCDKYICSKGALSGEYLLYKRKKFDLHQLILKEFLQSVKPKLYLKQKIFHWQIHQ